jgi:predicted Fe-S protein YdhL (DUF1289 family)
VDTERQEDELGEARLWVAASERRLREVWERCGERYARRLARDHQLSDPVEDILTLAARRVVPLPAPRRRGLSREGLTPVAVAFCRLVRPDRRALRTALAAKGAPLDEPMLAHATAAMWRLAEDVRATRRRNDAPPAGFSEESSEG